VEVIPVQEWISDNLVFSLVLCCVVPTILFALFAFFALRAGQSFMSRFITPDTETLRREFAQIQARNPNLTQDQLVQKIIHRQSLRTAIIGALTGLGGLFTLPIALPIDIYTSLSIQSQMVNFIAFAYGNRQISQIEQQVITTLVMSGSRQIAESSVKFVAGFTARILGKTLAKLVPFIGALTSFGVNYLLTQAIGRAAAQRYSGVSTRQV
jgi:hypothetical protein